MERSHEKKNHWNIVVSCHADGEYDDAGLCGRGVGFAAVVVFG